jgi:hypothetical protein
LNAPDKIGFDDNGQRVAVTDFDYGAVEPADKDAIIAEQAAKIENLETALARYREKSQTLLHFIFNTLLSGLPDERIAGRRAYFFAQTVFKDNPPFPTQAELGKHLGITGAAVSQQLNEFRLKNTLIPQ